MEIKNICPTCNGTGNIPTGYVDLRHYPSLDPNKDEDVEGIPEMKICEICKGSGKLKPTKLAFLFFQINHFLENYFKK